jgi:hypothetical protein
VSSVSFYTVTQGGDPFSVSLRPTGGAPLHPTKQETPCLESQDEQDDDDDDDDDASLGTYVRGSTSHKGGGRRATFKVGIRLFLKFSMDCVQYVVPTERKRKKPKINKKKGTMR